MTNLTEVTSDQLQALKDFVTSDNKLLVSELEEILDDVAKTGQYIFPWHFMKPLYAYKLEKVTEEFLDSTPPLKVDGTNDEEEILKLKEFRNDLLSIFDKFICAPFTIQRVSELLTNPKKHYKTTAKFFRGLEKNILVVSTVEHVPAEQRIVLKRSYVEEISEAEQNGYLESKPPAKKSVIEETDVKMATVENNTNLLENTDPTVDGDQLSNTTMETNQQSIATTKISHTPVESGLPSNAIADNDHSESVNTNTNGINGTETQNHVASKLNENSANISVNNIEQNTLQACEQKATEEAMEEKEPTEKSPARNDEEKGMEQD